jgi:hypothetical protein
MFLFESNRVTRNVHAEKQYCTGQIHGSHVYYCNYGIRLNCSWKSEVSVARAGTADGSMKRNSTKVWTRRLDKKSLCGKKFNGEGTYKLLYYAKSIQTWSKNISINPIN